jgi:biotin transporter BioY
VHVHPFSATSHFIVAFIFSLLVFSSVSHVYWTLRRNYQPKNNWDILFVHLPFSLWHAYALLAVLLSAFAAFSSRSPPDHPDLVEKIMVVAAEIFLTMTSIGYAFESTQGDLAGASVIALFLFGLYDR